MALDTQVPIVQATKAAGVSLFLVRAMTTAAMTPRTDSAPCVDLRAVSPTQPLSRTIGT